MLLTTGDVLVYLTVFVGVYTSVFFLMTLLENASSLRPRKQIPLETVTIIVPCYNEESTVGKTVESLLALDYPKNKLQIVVVDDGSTDHTYEIAKRYETRGVMVLKKRNGGKFTALNYAIERTDSVYVGALDADSFVDKHALKRIMPYFADKNVMAVTPSMKVYDPKTWLQKVQYTEYLMGVFLRKIFAFLGSIHVTPGPFSIYRRDVFKKYGLYKHAYNTEDIELALRLQLNNREIENAHDAYVYTVGPATFKRLWDQRLRWYYGFLRNTQDYKQLFSIRQGALGIFILPLSFLSVILVLSGLSYTIYLMLHDLFQRYLYLRATNWDLMSLHWSFEAFYLNMNSVAILGVIAMCVGIVVIYSAKRLAGEHRSIIRPYLWFMFTYWFLFAAWWLGAILMRVTGRKMTWRHKSE